MLPTPSTTHVPYDRVYEPAEDSYLLLDTLSSPSENSYLTSRFTSSHTPPPTVLEIGTGSGVVLAFLTAHASTIFARPDILTLGIDINPHACISTAKTVSLACSSPSEDPQDPSPTRKLDGAGFYVGNVLGDLGTPLRSGSVDVLVFNPPYVPTPSLPKFELPRAFEIPESPGAESSDEREARRAKESGFERDSRLLELSYAGGVDGMETTWRLLHDLPRILSAERGVAYVLLCAQNKPDDVKALVKTWGEEWEVETVGRSGQQAGWEKLVILRIARITRTPRLEPREQQLDIDTEQLRKKIEYRALTIGPLS